MTARREQSTLLCLLAVAITVFVKLHMGISSSVDADVPVVPGRLEVSPEMKRAVGVMTQGDASSVRWYCPADLDTDGDVDGVDFMTFAMCFNGPLNPPMSGCENHIADLDCDGDVDGVDFLTWSSCVGGPGRPAVCDW